MNNDTCMDEDEKFVIKVGVVIALGLLFLAGITDDDTHYVKWTCGENNGVMAVSEDSEINCK